MHMTHDPYQTYPTIGAFSGLANPFSSPYTAVQTSQINPGFGYNPLAANAGLYGGVGQQLGIPTYGGISPQQLQLAQALAAQSSPSQMFGQSPFINAWQNPFINAVSQNPVAALQNPFVAAALQREIIQNQLLQNQLAAAAQQNPLLNPILAAQLTGNLGQFGQGQQIGSQPFGQYHQQPGFSQPYQQQPYQQQGQAGWGLGQQQPSPFSQFNNPFAQATLAPQSWVGQGQQGQIHPLLLQSVARGMQPNQGISPWGTF